MFVISLDMRIVDCGLWNVVSRYVLVVQRTLTTQNVNT